MNFPENTSKEQKGIVWWYFAHFEKKFFLLIIIPFYSFVQKQLFKQIQFPLGLPLFKLVIKTYFLSISVILSEKVTFLTKKRSFSELARKCFKTSEKHSLAVCGSL